VTDIMGEISAASSEQSAGVAQVGEAVTHMDQATQQNAALVEEMAAAAEQPEVAGPGAGANRGPVQARRPRPCTGQHGATGGRALAANQSHRLQGQRATGWRRPRGAAARAAPSTSETAAKLPPPRPVESPVTATGSDEGDWESF